MLKSTIEVKLLKFDKMDGELNQNLPTTPRRKPIFTIKRSARSSSVKSQKRAGRTEKYVEERAHPKRIKYNNPDNYWVTEDGFVHPLDHSENFSPLNLANMSNKVAKVKYDNSNGVLCYYLTPKFDVSDVYPWRLVSEKFKNSEEKHLVTLSQSFENLMECRDKFFQKELLKKYREKTAHTESVKFTFDDKLPQFAEVRQYVKVDHLEHCPIKKIALNRPMQDVLGVDPQSEGTESFYRGIKNSLRISDSKEGYSFLCAMYECYRQCYEQSEAKYNEKVFPKVSVPSKEGKELFYEVKAKPELQEEAIVVYYTMYLNELAASETSFQDTEKLEATSGCMNKELNKQQAEQRIDEQCKKASENYVSSFAKSFPEYEAAIAEVRKKQICNLKK